jgi:flagellar hook assembly protein FlgD
MQLGLRPNPSRGTTTIEYSLSSPGAARITVLDVQGRRIARFDEPTSSAGANWVHWNGRDEAGRPAPPGAYVVRLEVTGKSVTRRMALVR